MAITCSRSIISIFLVANVSENFERNSVNVADMVLISSFPSTTVAFCICNSEESLNIIFNFFSFPVRHRTKIGAGGSWLTGYILISVAALNRNKPSYMNTVNLIYTLINTDVSGTETWTATQDCYCVAELCAAGNDYYNASIILDGIAVARNSNDQIIMVNFPVKQGQIIKKSYGKVTCKFYSML